MSNKVQVKVHPDVQTDNNVPNVLPPTTWVISHKTNLFIDGKYVLKFKVSMLIRKDGEQDPTYTYSRYKRFGFMPPKNMDDFYKVSLYCYQTAVIEFNNSLDEVFGKDRFQDCGFDEASEVYAMVDNALNPRIN